MLKPKYSIGSLLVLITLAAGGVAYYQFANSEPYFIEARDYPKKQFSTDFHDVRIETDLNLEDVEAFPCWDRRWNHPPLAAGKAIRIAESYRRNMLGPNELLKDHFSKHEWQFKSVELVRLSGTGEVWVWIVNFAVHRTDVWYVLDDPPFVSLLVKMDGSIVKPRVD